MGDKIISLKNIELEIRDEDGYIETKLTNISLDIESYKISCMISNSTKINNLIAKIISGLVQPKGGETEIRKKTVLIPSQPSSFPWLNVKENILFNLNDYEPSDLKKIINLVGLDGYEKHVANNKSMGFRFRISLARALMNSAEVLVLDEPFVFMNHQTKLECMRVIKSLVNKIKLTVFFSSRYVLDSVSLADIIYVLNDNNIISKVLQEENSEVNHIDTIQNILTL